jgi:hypothetical protein
MIITRTPVADIAESTPRLFVVTCNDYPATPVRGCSERWERKAIPKKIKPSVC